MKMSKLGVVNNSLQLRKLPAQAFRDPATVFNEDRWMMYTFLSVLD